MAPRMRRNLSGVFVAQDRGRGAWVLSRTAPHEAAVFLRDAEADAARAFGAAQQLIDLGIEWHAEKALLTFLSGGQVESVAAASAIVHEPLGELYDRLPLASIDADARRFWRRVFAVVRLPGGRLLLKLLTRSNKRR
jgi:ABC-type Mn2+/Zn2+ transport system ATPase subunit